MALPSQLADWSAFLEQISLTMSSHKSDNEAHGGHYMKGMGLKMTPVVVRHLLGHLGLCIWLAFL